MTEASRQSSSLAPKMLLAESKVRAADMTNTPVILTMSAQSKHHALVPNICWQQCYFIMECLKDNIVVIK